MQPIPVSTQLNPPSLNLIKLHLAVQFLPPLLDLLDWIVRAQESPEFRVDPG